MNGETKHTDLFGEGQGPAKKDRIEFFASAADYPTVYADGCIFATRVGSIVKLTFYETIVEPADSNFPGVKHRPVGTLNLPLDGYANMLSYLNEMTPKFIFPPQESNGE